MSKVSAGLLEISQRLEKINIKSVSARELSSADFETTYNTVVPNNNKFHNFTKGVISTVSFDAEIDDDMLALLTGASEKMDSSIIITMEYSQEALVPRKKHKKHRVTKKWITASIDEFSYDGKTCEVLLDLKDD